jgi:nucleoside-diphosphate-sugar epimerase
MATEERELHVVFGTGPVGSAVAAELALRDRRVRVVNRSGRFSGPADIEVVRGDAGDPAFARSAAAGGAVVYQTLNPGYQNWPERFPPLQAAVLAAAEAAGARLVAMENLYMYGPTGGRPLTEDLPYVAETRKGRTRAQMADDLLAAHRQGRVAVAIGRASDFFGPGVLDSAVGERTFYPALAGKPVQVIGDPDVPHTYTYVADIGRALVILGERAEALGRAWHLPSPPTVTTREFLELVFRAAGQRPRVQRVPKLVLRAVGLANADVRELVEMTYEFEEPFVVDHSDFARAFGDQATPLAQATSTTVEWFRRHPRTG